MTAIDSFASINPFTFCVTFCHYVLYYLSMQSFSQVISANQFHRLGPNLDNSNGFLLTELNRNITTNKRVNNFCWC